KLPHELVHSFFGERLLPLLYPLLVRPIRKAIRHLGQLLPSVHCHLPFSEYCLLSIVLSKPAPCKRSDRAAAAAFCPAAGAAQRRVWVAPGSSCCICGNRGAFGDHRVIFCPG